MNLLGMDFGEKNIGLALSRDGFVSPLTNLKYQKDHKLEKDAIEYIKKIVEIEGIVVIVIGEIDRRNEKLAPARLASESVAGVGRLSNKDKLMINQLEFINRLKRTLKAIRFEYVSEKYTSKEAVISQIEYGISKKASRNTDHPFAAAEILKRYLEN